MNRRLPIEDPPIERLPPQPGEWIDRDRVVRFRFEGQEYEGYEGDTVSSALLANGVRVLGRSFKYHRPRGIFSLADTDCNAMMQSAAETNIRADLTPVRDGLDLRAVNTVGGVKNDLLRVLDHFGKFTPVGFYYKAFHTPRKLFPFFERRIRALAGLGAVSRHRKTRTTPKDYAHTDVLVVGAGPAGMSAALAAAESGARVVLVDSTPHLGGTLNYQLRSDQSQELRSRLVSQVNQQERIEVRTRTTAVGHYADRWVALVDAERLTKLRAGAVVVATGCDEQPAVFRNNDLPGVMLGSAVQKLIHQYAVRPFSYGSVLTANSEGYQVALDLKRAGVTVGAVFDLRPDGEQAPVAKECADAGVSIECGYAIHEAVPYDGKRSIRGVNLYHIETGRVSEIDGDGVAVSVGWTPADGLLRQVGARMSYSKSLEQFVPTELPPGVFAAGRVSGVYELDEQLEDGRRAGEEAARDLQTERQEPTSVPVRHGPSRSYHYPIVPHKKGKEFVDLDEDLQLKDFANAIQEGFDNVELLKRYSTFGMGPSQGRHSNLLALRILSRIRGENMADKQMTTARPFTTPVSLAHLAGRSFLPVKHTPMHPRHETLGAKFMYAGNWLRSEFYAQDGKAREECIAAEALNVRQRVGLIDLGTLGKVEINGADATVFIESFYAGRFAKLKVGRSRYGVVCDESGVVVDDGVICRLAEDRYYLSTTTSGAEGIYREMQRCALQWQLDVTLSDLTDQYTAMNIAGPLSRKVLEALTDIPLAHADFPYLSVREGDVAGVSARVSRVGFVGELGYEIHVPASGGLCVWDELMKAGADRGIRAFGVEAQRLLRLEKAHLIVGQDTDGLTQPSEAELGWAVKMDKPFFVGQRSLKILQKRPLTRVLVGFVLPNGHRRPIPKECHLVIEADEIAGRVTSVSFSPTLEQVIGLAYVRPEQRQPGTKIIIRVDGGILVDGTVVETPFYDPENQRQQDEVRDGVV